MISTFGLALLSLASPPQAEPELSVPHFSTQLSNGLTVIVHEDHSDPVVAVYVAYHVGSGREELGKSGFAHLFEHMLFQGSEHVGDDQHFKYVSEAGGTLNGTTNTDRTLYFETLPSNQLETALWLEADRMGFLLPAVTQEKLTNQIDVVRNERRQNYDNRPYGMVRGAIAAAMYPAGHPYSWLTIGSHEDLEAASLEDVHAFFRRWYGPNNAVLAIGGDVSTSDAMALVQKYFGPISRGPEVAQPELRPIALESDVRLVLEDEVQRPQLTLAWPGTTTYSDDDYALDMLARILSENRAAVLDRALTVDAQLAENVSARNESAEIAGTFTITVTAAPGVTLDTLEERVRGLLAQLSEKGVDPEHLQRMKNLRESEFVRGLETVSRRTSLLATYATFVADPGYFDEDLARALAVTPAQVKSALDRYLIGKPAVIASCVPMGEFDAAASGRTAGQIAVEDGFDRSQKPTAAPAPTFHTPATWQHELANGLHVYAAVTDEIPVTTLSLALPGGRDHESLAKLGISSLTAQLMSEGTTKLSTTELADALDSIGADLSVRAGADDLTISLSVLDKHLPVALALFADVALTPRCDPADFERLRARRLSAIDSRGDSIRGIAGTVWDRLMYGPDSVFGQPGEGTRETVEALTLEDVRAFHAAALDARAARLSIATGQTPEHVDQLLADLVERWPAQGARAAVARPASAAASLAPEGRIYLVDKPGAAQSEIRIGHMSVSTSDQDYWPLFVLNYPLGGAFSSRINMNLREDKGYTYGARSSFAGGRRPAPFTASAGVQTAVTAAAVAEFLGELGKIRDGLTPEELEFVQSSLTQSELRRYESARARLSLVDEAAEYGWSPSYVEERLARLAALTLRELGELARKHLHPEELLILVVGDKQEILDDLLALDLGPVIELDIDGNRL